MMNSNTLHRDNHYVPCVYLKQWASPDGRVWTYRVLASHENVPLWRRNSPRAMAYHSHLYTEIVAGEETDEFERWLDRDFETPAEVPLRKATSGSRLTPEDWKHLVRFLAAQDVRTPASFSEKTKSWNESIPSLLENTLQDSIRKVEEAQRTGQPIPPPRKVEDREGLPMRVITKKNKSGGGEIGAEMLVGRQLWLWSIKRALNRNINALLQHRWTILCPPKGSRWFTSDNPVIRLNYNSVANYNFGGGWASRGTEIFLPLDHQHLLFTQVGKRPPQRGERMTIEQAQLVRRFTAEHAWRMIFADEPAEEIATLRPRIVDPAGFQHESAQWANWHRQQTEAERDIESKLPEVRGSL